MRTGFLTTVAAVAAGMTLGTFAAFAAVEHRIEQTGRAFVPSELTVKAGDTLVFVNDDYYDHNVYSESAGNAFNIGIQEPGNTTRVMLSKPGRVDVLCRIHPKMTLAVTVEP